MYFDKSINIAFIKNIASTYGNNKDIAKALGIPYNTFLNYLYRADYFINNEKYDKSKVFAKAVQEGKLEYKLKKIDNE